MEHFFHILYNRHPRKYMKTTIQVIIDQTNKNNIIKCVKCIKSNFCTKLEFNESSHC